MRSRILRAVLVCATLFTVLTLAPHADTSIQPLPLVQEWTDISAISADDDWSRVAGIIGYRGDGLTGGTAVNPQGVLADGSGTPVDVIVEVSVEFNLR